MNPFVLFLVLCIYSIKGKSFIVLLVQETGKHRGNAYDNKHPLGNLQFGFRGYQLAIQLN